MTTKGNTEGNAEKDGSASKSYSMSPPKESTSVFRISGNREEEVVDKVPPYDERHPRATDVRDDRLTLAPESIKRATYKHFKGIMVPVFTCFKQNETRSLNVSNIPRYAEMLRRNRVVGVLINGVIGEGPTMAVKERKANCEYWHRAAVKNNLLIMVQVGGAPLADVLSLASHAEDMGVSAVCTLPELFFRPRDVDQLVAYCRLVAEHCRTRPFFYYHIPSMTGVDYMVEFCAKAEKIIPNFLGVHFVSSDLEMGQKCLRSGRVIFQGSSALVASALMSGFKSISVPVTNCRPDIVEGIYDAYYENDLRLSRERQDELNRLIEIHTHRTYMQSWVVSMKEWFNKELSMRSPELSFTTGPARKYY
ncbi:N-acetylneuraminate lyase-like isoform X2 [Scaptodrosophila lebanonensis]|uniref:N-acetylneuraminate lyase n=1 Tax=Drosophila lebanonensis TaxID=7225 RepID=A0A6J2U5J6_DROLE|nr:N-acetylneuraminate lyase-like isoform X2 [Scaptodrosophila lebanonensis]